MSGALAATRDSGIDCARGLAMVLVVLGHNAAFAALSPPAVAWIFTFHVAAFFFLSGALLRPARFSLARSARRILLPFAVIGLLLTVARGALRGEDLGNALLGLLWGTGATLLTWQLWFLPTLFCALLLAVGIVRGGFHFSRPRLALLVLAALLALAWLALRIPAPAWADTLRRPGVPNPPGWFWSVDLLPLAIFFVLMGYGAAAAGWLARLRPWMALPALALVTACFMLGARTDMNLRLVAQFPLAIVAGLAGCLAVWACGRAIARHAPAAIARVLTLVGQHSILILAFHVIAQGAAVRASRRLLGDGSVALAVATAAGLLAGVLLPLLLSLGIDGLKKRRPTTPTASPP